MIAPPSNLPKENLSKISTELELEVYLYLYVNFIEAK
jgi:hypothetical protein